MNRRWFQPGLGCLAALTWALLPGVVFLAQAAADTVPAFRTGILPVLTKAGCNSGGCHGAATGQGGFKLSLLGYDPAEDFDRITREAGGRRLDGTEPARSLLLRKPSGELEHEGGRRMLRHSDAYQKVLAWIEAGAPYGPQDLRIVNLEVSPVENWMTNVHDSVSLRVTAKRSDGISEDVTALALYSSNDDAVAEVTKQGEVQVKSRGVTSIMVRYAGQVAAARLLVPFGKATPDRARESAEHWIDREIGGELQRLGLPRSSVSSDGEFLRRAHLDLTGRLPGAKEARAFLQEPPSAGKRRRLVEALLASPEFADYWTMRLADLLLLGGRRGNESSTRAYQAWLRQQVVRNTPFDQVARELLTAQGSLTGNGPANFFTLATDPRDLAEHVGRIFLGTQIACARCHAHPADRWTQEDYHRFAAHFARVAQADGMVQVSARGEIDDPKTGEVLLPRPLGAAPGRETGRAEQGDRRMELARWLTSPETPAFSRTLVNRVWKALLGRGLVEPVDDLRPTNPATYPRVLDLLAREFVEQGHDLRRLLRTIANTRTYQLTSRTVDGNQQDDRFYSHAYLKELAAPVFLDAVGQVTSQPESFAGYAEGTRAVQLMGPRTPSYALDVLGRCTRDSSCEAGVRRGGGLAQALHLMNGPVLNGKLRGVVTELRGQGLSSSAIVEELYWRALTRPPSATETRTWQDALAKTTEPEEVLQDLLWALLNAREFAFNH